MRARERRSPGKTAGLLALASTLLVPACGDDGVTEVPPPRTGQLDVSTASMGSALDPDGYQLELNGEGSLPIGVNGSVAVSGLVPGQYDVELTGLSTSCHVIGENPQTVAVENDEDSSVAFEVSCPPYHDYIAFIGSQGGPLNIWLMRPDGSGLVNLTREALGPSWPSWSRDATQIAFSRGGIGTEGIYILDMADLSVRRLTTAGVCPCSWSPDDGRLLYTLLSQTGPSAFTVHVYAINLDGSDSRLLTPGPDRAADPAWSPDGNRIAFIQETSGFQDIWLMDPDGSNKTKLTDLASAVAPPLIPIAYEPDWSPDGTRIAFAGPGEFSGPRIWTVDANGTNLTMLTSGGGGYQAWHPSWSPDGARIAFWARKGAEPSPQNTYEIYVMNADGSNEVDITNDPGSETDPSWSW